MLAGRADWLDAAAPYLAGGGATKAVTSRGVVWQEGAARHEGGSPNVIGAIALAAACHALRTHAEAVEEHERTLGRRLLDGLDAIEGVQTYSLFGPDHERVAVATFTVDGVDPSLVSAALSAEHGIGVRDGKFCAHLCVDALLDDPYAAASTTAVRAERRPGHDRRARRAAPRRGGGAGRGRPPRRVRPRVAGLVARERPAGARPRPPLVAAHAAYRGSAPQASMTTGMIIGRRRILPPTQPPDRAADRPARAGGSR